MTSSGLPESEDPGALLHPFSPGELDRYPDSVFAVDAQGRIFYVNRAWDAFAAANGAPPTLTSAHLLGADVFAAIPPPLEPFYRELFASAARPRTPADGPLTHTYECSSPSSFRLFQMSIYPVERGLVVVNACVVERPHTPSERTPHAPSEAYRDAAGMLHQCCHCRRITNLEVPGRWDWVPDWVEHFPPGTSHTLCEPCFAFYYGPRPRS